MTRSSAVVAAVSLLIVLAGCTAAPPDGDSPAAPSPEPTETASPASGPTPFIDATCTDLLGDAVIAPAVSEPVDARELPEFRELSWVDVPRGAAVQQLGGLTCEWSNGVLQADDVTVPEYRGVYLSVLPDAAAEWPKFAGYVDPATGRSEGCSDYSGATRCHYDSLVGSTWVHLELAGATSTTAYQPLADAVEAALAAATPTGATWTPPDGTLPIDLDCAALDGPISMEFGTPNVAVNDGGGGWSQEASSWSAAGILGFGCSYVYEGTNLSASTVEISGYTGAGWALRAAQNGDLIPTNPTLHSGSMEDGDDAWIECATELDCTVHILVANGWIRADMNLVEDHADVDAEQFLIVLTDLLVTQVRA